jgi:hypothetical protein
VRSLVAGRASKEVFDSQDLMWEQDFEWGLHIDRIRKIKEQKVGHS